MPHHVGKLINYCNNGLIGIEREYTMTKILPLASLIGIMNLTIKLMYQKVSGGGLMLIKIPV